MNGTRWMQVLTGLSLTLLAASCGSDGGGNKEELNLELQQVGTSGVPGFDPSIAVDSAGRFAVAWAEGDPRQPLQIYLQGFTAAGFTDGARISVGTGRTPAAAFGPGGELFVAWGDGAGVQLQRYATNGSPLGAPARVSSEGFPWDLDFGDGGQGVLLSGNNPCIPGSRCPADRFAVARLAADGSPAGPVRILTKRDGFLSHATVAMLPDGSFAIATLGYIPQFQSFTATGSPAGAPVKLADPGVTESSWLRAVPGGGFVYLNTSVYHHVRGQGYAADGTPLGAGFTVPLAAAPAFAVGPDGSMVVVGPLLDNGQPVQAHRLRADGTPAGAPIFLSNETLFTQSVALGPKGRFLVASFFPGSSDAPRGPMRVQLFAEKEAS
jgi:hypothetical protein